MMTGHPGIFAGGDMASSERTVTVALGHGKRGGAPHRRLVARHPLRRGPTEPQRQPRCSHHRCMPRRPFSTAKVLVATYQSTGRGKPYTTCLPFSTTDGYLGQDRGLFQPLRW